MNKVEPNVGVSNLDGGVVKGLNMPLIYKFSVNPCDSAVNYSGL